MRKSRVLVVDDSASMRQLISAVLNAAPDLEVVGHAADPLEAREAIKSLSPDVVTLDVEMPNMNGIDFLERLMRLRSTPVIMVSSLTRRGGEVTTRALEIGAVDCVMKPALGDAKPFGDLAEKVRMAAGARLQPGGPAARQGETSGARMSGAYEPDGRIVAIGSSTGGVEALTAVLTVLPRNCAPVVVTQHMPPMFTRSFADRLDKLCAATVAEASDGAPLLPGHIYIAPGGAQHLEVLAGAGLRGEGTGALRCRLRQRPLVNGHCPSVDVLFHSVVKAAGPRAVGVILTGMGRDGAEGLLAMRQAGAATLGQDAASSLIYGMPKTAFEIGAVERQVPLKRIGVEIATMTNKSDRR